MKIGIYQPYWGEIGGSQFYAAVLAQALSQNHSVHIVHPRRNFDRQEIEEKLQLDLSKVAFRPVPPMPRAYADTCNPIRRIRTDRCWGESLSTPYDVFINSFERVPFACHAPKGVLVTHFPFERFESFYRMYSEGWRRKGLLARLLSRSYYITDWSYRFGTYPLKIASSKFTQRWLKRLWGANSHVVYPPVRDGFVRVAKGNHIVSVARFYDDTRNHHKKQPILIDTFQQLAQSSLQAWEYQQIGYLLPERDTPYYDGLVARAQGYPIRLIANASGKELRSCLEEAKIFWHATGFGEDETTHPERMEHFGITTVEAMAAGCVPIVINSGGQPEIVEHGVNGFLWNTLGELKHYTSLVSRDEALRERLSEAARRRARMFSREEFVKSVLRVMEPLLR